MRRTAILAVLAMALVTVSFTENAAAQNGYFPEPPPISTPNGYVFDPTYGWKPRASFFGGYNTGSYSSSGRYGLYRRATPYNSYMRNSGAPRYGGYGPGIGENRRYGGADYYAR